MPSLSRSPASVLAAPVLAAPVLAALLLLASLLIAAPLPAVAGPSSDGAPLSDEGRSDDIRFALNRLSPSFIGDADAVVRLNEHVYEVENEEEAVHRVHRAVTVFGPDARDHGLLVIPYDRFREVDEVEGWIRNADGEVIRKLSRDDQRDVSGNRGPTLYSDFRLHVAELYDSRYPYTVEYKYEVEIDGYASWPTWAPQASGDVPVERARFVLDAPAEMNARYTVRQGEIEHRSETRDDRRVHTWETTLTPKAERDPQSPSWRHQRPTLYLAPDRFSQGGYAGSMSTWEDMSAWVYSMREDRRTLPPDLAAEVDRIVAATSTERETAAALFRYQQDRMRYVSVQLGIGGFRPFDVQYVHDRKYGDCKALSNYYWAMLDHAGIEAYTALIYRSSPNYLPPPFPEDFPGNRFNHEIVMVPTDGDTLWAEPTSRTMPFGHVDAGIADRPALVVRPSGGRLVRTPDAAASANRRSRTVRLSINERGDARAKVTTRYTGMLADDPRALLTSATTKETHEWLRDRIDAPQVDVQSVEVGSVNAHGSSVTVTSSVDLPRYASAAGSRLFIPVLPAGRWEHVPEEGDRPREQRVFIAPFRMSSVDTVVVTPPPGYRIEAAPDSVQIDAPFGRYVSHATASGDGTITYVRESATTRRTLPPEAFATYRQHTRTVARSDRAQLVLVRE